MCRPFRDQDITELETDATPEALRAALAEHGIEPTDVLAILRDDSEDDSGRGRYRVIYRRRVRRRD